VAKDIGIGVIGIGMGLALCPLNRDPNARLEVRGLCATRPDRLAAAAREWGIGFTTTDYRELLRRPDIDAVGVYSPDHLHAEHVLAALRAGKHVVCTKPLVTRVEDAAAIVRLVDQTGLKLLVGQTMRFDSQFVAAHRLWADGDLGDIVFAEAHYVHDLRGIWELTPWRLQAPQDFMFGGVSHPVDLLRWFFGDVDAVHALGRRGNLTPEYPLIDNFLLNLTFKDGVIARVLGAYGVVHPPLPMMGLRLYGTKGSLSAEFTDQQGGPVKLVSDKVPQHPVAVMDFPPELEGAYGHGPNVLRYMRHFEECLTQNREPSPNARDGAKSIAVCAAAWESIRSGSVVQVRNEF
jgi:predicted dehydrogenase